MRLADIPVGAYFTVWHNEDSKHSQLYYSRVTKHNRATTWIRTECGDHKKIDNHMTVEPVAEGHWHPEISGLPPGPNDQSAIVKVTKNHVTVRFTHEQARQLFSVANAANQDGDHRDWLKSAGAKPNEIRALSEVMDIVAAMKDAAKWTHAPRSFNRPRLRQTTRIRVDAQNT